MKLISTTLLMIWTITTFGVAAPGDPPARKTPREAFRPLGDLIGAWRGTGEPKVKTDKLRDFWTEKLDWQWQFKGNDAWLKVSFDNAKNFTVGELRYLADKDLFEFTTLTPDKKKLTWQGSFKDKALTLERHDAEADQDQRLVFTLLHSNRFLYSYAIKDANKATFTNLYRVGVTKEGVPFAGGDGKPECIVSGGLGTIAVRYMGQTYYVCCSGCRDEFNDNPKKYVDEYNAKKKKQ
jgi:hypothetical protein